MRSLQEATLANRRDIYGDETKGNIDPIQNNQGSVDQWGNPPSGYIPGVTDLGQPGAGGSAETPRERQQLPGVMQGGVGSLPEPPQQHQQAPSPEGPITSTPRQPSAPTPAGGQTFQAGPPDVGTMQGLQPFAPMQGPDAISQASPKLRSLYGSQGGLQGGGLGVPGAASAATNDPIALLLQQLLGQSGA